MWNLYAQQMFFYIDFLQVHSQQVVREENGTSLGSYSVVCFVLETMPFLPPSLPPFYLFI